MNWRTDVKLNEINERVATTHNNKSRKEAAAQEALAEALSNLGEPQVNQEGPEDAQNALYIPEDAPSISKPLIKLTDRDAFKRHKYHDVLGAFSGEPEGRQKAAIVRLTPKQIDNIIGALQAHRGAAKARILGEVREAMAQWAQSGEKKPKRKYNKRTLGD